MSTRGGVSPDVRRSDVSTRRGRASRRAGDGGKGRGGGGYRELVQVAWEEGAVGGDGGGGVMPGVFVSGADRGGGVEVRCRE